MEYEYQSSAELPLWYYILIFAIVIVQVIALWRVFQKAGKPGWGILVPIYNIILLVDIAGKPRWWAALFLLAIIPFVGSIAVIVVAIILYIDIAKNFGKSAGFGVGMALLSFIFIPILAFGDARYLPLDNPEEAFEGQKL